MRKPAQLNGSDVGEPSGGASARAANIGGGDTVNPDTIPSPSGSATRDGGSRKSGGWPKGRKRNANAPGSQTVSEAVNPHALEMLLMGVHGQLASLLKAPEFALAPVEAKHLADAAAKVAAFYPGVGLDPKTAAWFNLGQVALLVYGPKVFNMRKRKRDESAARSRNREHQTRMAETGADFDGTEGAAFAGA